jgi:hypothetical protein
VTGVVAEARSRVLAHLSMNISCCPIVDVGAGVRLESEGQPCIVRRVEKRLPTSCELPKRFSTCPADAGAIG